MFEAARHLCRSGRLGNAEMLVFYGFRDEKGRLKTGEYVLHLIFSWSLPLLNTFLVQDIRSFRCGKSRFRGQQPLVRLVCEELE